MNIPAVLSLAVILGTIIFGSEIADTVSGGNAYLGNLENLSKIETEIKTPENELKKVFTEHSIISSPVVNPNKNAAGSANPTWEETVVILEDYSMQAKELISRAREARVSDQIFDELNTLLAKTKRLSRSKLEDREELYEISNDLASEKNKIGVIENLRDLKLTHRRAVKALRTPFIKEWLTYDVLVTLLNEIGLRIQNADITAKTDWETARQMIGDLRQDKDPKFIEEVIYHLRDLHNAGKTVKTNPSKLRILQKIVDNTNRLLNKGDIRGAHEYIEAAERNFLEILRDKR